MPETIQVLDKTFVKYITDKQIEEAIQRVADQINEDYKNDTPIVLITLNGAVFLPWICSSESRCPAGSLA